MRACLPSTALMGWCTVLFVVLLPTLLLPACAGADVAEPPSMTVDDGNLLFTLDTTKVGERSSRL